MKNPNLVYGHEYQISDRDKLISGDYVALGVEKGKRITYTFPEKIESLSDEKWEDSLSFIYRGNDDDMFKPLHNDVAFVLTTVGPMKRQVVCAANKFGDLIVLGVRHFCPLMRQTLRLLKIKGTEPHEQGFVDQWGNFMSRKEALYVLRSNGRFIPDRDFTDELYSENLY